MTDRPHLHIRRDPQAIPYRYAGGGGRRTFELPPRDRVPHAQHLIGELNAAVQAFDQRRNDALARDAQGLQIALRSDAEYPLRLEALDRRTSGIELVSVGKEDGVTVATVFVPYSKIGVFLRLFEAYAQGTTKYGKPKNKRLVESIASARLAIAKDFWRDSLPFPEAIESITWEIWLRSEDDKASAVHAQFVRHCHEVKLRPSAQFIAFPDRVVSLASGTHAQIASSLNLLSTIAELRKAKELASAYMQQPPRFHKQLVDALLGQVTFPGGNAPAVCVLDTGVNSGHPLLAPALASNDMHAVDDSWGTADHSAMQHGTGMAGIALYGSLTDVLETNQPVALRHRLESAKILPPAPLENEREVYGAVTKAGVAKAIIAAPMRNRVLCMAVTADHRDRGVPSSWSGAVDQMCSGVGDEIPKLMFVSAGNYREIRDDTCEYDYPTSNCSDAGVEDPAQAWNVVTVGAYTEKVFIEDASFKDWHPIGIPGDLCPSSRTSLAWGESFYAGWPIKPEIVMEGGNYATDGNARDMPDDLSLLSTGVSANGALFQCVGDTSPATADGSRLAATLWSYYPELWPETIRALLVHSARWTEAMMARFPGEKKGVVHHRLRCYGYGVPSLQRARASAENHVTLIFEGEIQPYRLVDGIAKTNVMHLHRLPWPKDVLEGLGDTEVTMRVTLSYFVEPSPGRRGWDRSHRYQSHGLRFDVRRPTETDEEFQKRLTKHAWDDPDTRPDNSEETREWTVGPDGRTNGSLHCDWWTGTAAELAACGDIAVYPVTGWWKERAHKGRVESTARYSLVVSIETRRTDVDLYAAVANQIAIDVDVAT